MQLERDLEMYLHYPESKYCDSNLEHRQAT
jgi:hypothetical protein